MKALDFVSLFAGAGGLDLGLEESGWRCRYASDIDPAAVATLEANQGRPLASGGGSVFEGAFIEEADIRQLSADDISGNLRDINIIRFTCDLASNDQGSRRHEAFTGHTGIGIFGKKGI